MRGLSLAITLLAMSTAAYAASTRVMATRFDGVTLDQLKAASTPINIAKFDVDGGHMGVRCAGSTGQLICEVFNMDRNELVAASSDLKVCKDGNDFALMGDKVGPGKMIIIPNGLTLGDPTKQLVCAG